MKRRNEPDEEFSSNEARQRFEAALRGARITGHKPMSEVKVSKKAKPTKAKAKAKEKRK